MNSVDICNHNSNKDGKLQEYHGDMRQFKVKESHSGTVELASSLTYGAWNTVYVHSHSKSYEVCLLPEKEKERWNFDETVN